MTQPTTGNDAPSARSVAVGALPEQPGAPTAAEEVIRRIERSSGMLASRAVVRMHDVLPWFANMSARHRADIQLVVQAGISSFVEWCRRPEHARELSGDVFRVAPRDLVRAVTFRRLVDLVRVAVEAIEAEVPALAGPDHEQRLLADVLRYSRDIAFAGAVVYARAAEERGAWDARLEALVVDHVVRGEVERALPSRAAALGWRNPPAVAVIIGDAPDHSPEVVVDEVHRLGRGAGLEVLTGVHHERLVVIVGGDFACDQASRSVRSGGQAQRALLDAAEALLPACGPGPVVIGPIAADLAAAASSAHAALAAADVVAAWPAAPRPVTAQALLPERALAGDTGARRALVDEVYIPLREAGAPLLATAGAYLDFGASLEATARALYLHPNTVRYRLRKAADVCGLDPTDHRERFTLHIALILGRLTAT
ncbi:PucR family transcriptional regulator [Frankia sp. Cr2]|uniref:PucR family transcriptional regulator n=1 Tax=Frankia sp. Cr2 TaxID=3073932 RepID=UPI003A0FF46C